MNFPAGSASGSQVVSITILNDLHVEGDDTIETDLNNLADGTGGQISIGSLDAHTVTITDDDVAIISFVQSTSMVGEAAQTHTVDVTIDILGGGLLLRSLSVDVGVNATLPGSAIFGTDYNFSPQTVTWFVSPFVSTQSVSLNVLDDFLSEGNETVNLQLSNLGIPTGARVTIAAPSAHEVTIVDNDAQSLIVTPTSVSVTEDATSTFTVKLAFQPAGDVTVNVGSASGDSDLSVNSGGSLTFDSSNWNTAQTVTLAAAKDDDTENGSAVFNVSSSGLTTVGITATEADNDNHGNNAPPIIDSLSAPDFDNLGLFGQSVTLSGSFSDADLADTHTVTINWGDGNYDVLTLGQVNQEANSFAAEHVYDTGSIYTAIVAVSDGTDIDTQATSVVITGVGLIDGTLYIIGTDGRGRRRYQTRKRRWKVVVETTSWLAATETMISSAVMAMTFSSAASVKTT